jgi:hypothetical protein
VDGKFFAPLLATEKPAPEEWRTGFLWGTCHPTYQAVRTNGHTYVERAGGKRKLYNLGEATHHRGAQLARNPSGRKDSHDVRLKSP